MGRASSRKIGAAACMPAVMFLVILQVAHATPTSGMPPRRCFFFLISYKVLRVSSELSNLPSWVDTFLDSVWPKHESSTCHDSPAGRHTKLWKELIIFPYVFAYFLIYDKLTNRVNANVTRGDSEVSKATYFGVKTGILIIFIYLQLENCV